LEDSLLRAHFKKYVRKKQKYSTSVDLKLQQRDFVKNGYFSKLLKKDSCLVNSLHGQAIGIIANNLKIKVNMYDLFYALYT